MDFGLLPDKARRAAFAKMDAADKAKKGAKIAPRKRAAKKTAPKKPAGKAAPKQSLADFGVKRDDQFSRQHLETGVMTDRDLELAQRHFQTMRGRPMTPKEVADLKAKNEKQKRRNALEKKRIDRFRAAQAKK